MKARLSYQEVWVFLKIFFYITIENLYELTVITKKQAQGIGSLQDWLFLATKQNVTKLSTTQIVLAVVMASLSKMHRMNRIENFF